MFELSLKGRASVCLVKKGKNISGIWKKIYGNRDIQEHVTAGVQYV